MKEFGSKRVLFTMGRGGATHSSSPGGKKDGAHQRMPSGSQEARRTLHKGKGTRAREKIRPHSGSSGEGAPMGIRKKDPQRAKQSTGRKGRRSPVYGRRGVNTSPT